MVVDRFFSWVAEATVEQKFRAVEALATALHDHRVSDAEREAIEAALMLVAEDPDMAVRRRLAEVLAADDHAPRHLLLGLLDDHPSVARPIASRSQALIDAELVDLVAHGCDEIRLAVAGRDRVGPSVAAALAEAGDRATCVALLANPGSETPPIALERIVERFGEFAEIRRALLDRPHVPITVRHRVLEKLAEAMENLVVVKSWMGRERAEVTTRDSKDKATVALAASAGTAETVVLVEHLRRTGQLTTRLMLRAACVGNLRFVEEALARLADVPSTRVAALVADGRENALRALYRRAAMPERAWPAFHAAVEVHRELVGETGGLDGRPGDQARFSRRLVERVLTRFAAFESRDADDLLVLLRRYAADAARDHVRHVMAERMADATRSLPAPQAEEAEPELPAAASVGAASPAPDIDAAVFDAVAAELGVAIAEDVAEASGPVVDEIPVVTPSFAVSEPEPAAEAEDTGEYEGLFAHVRLEDLPPEWLADEEIAPEAIFGDDEISVRRAVTPDLRLVVDEADFGLRGSDETSFSLRGTDDGEMSPACDFEPADEDRALGLDEAASLVSVEPEFETADAAPLDADFTPIAEETVATPPFAETQSEAASAEPPIAGAETAVGARDTDAFVDGLRAALDAVLAPRRRAA
jgi:uncharacterized protein (DUF2336 family)